MVHMKTFNHHYLNGFSSLYNMAAGAKIDGHCMKFEIFSQKYFLYIPLHVFL